MLLTKTVVGVPGQWRSRADLAAALHERTGLAFDGARSALCDARGEAQMAVEVYDRDETLRTAFEYASVSTFAPELYEAIDRHTMTVYLVDAEGGSVERAAHMMRCARAFLDAGGLAVKVESAGVAHSADAWREMQDLGAWVRAFVVSLADEHAMESCGMQNLGLRDARVLGGGEEARATLDAFLRYQTYESPQLDDGHTFRRTLEARRYRLTGAADDRYPPADLFHNPRGLWQLEPIDEPA